MPVFELPVYVTMVMSFLTLCVTVWIGYSLDRYVHYDHPRVSFRQRLRHPRTDPRQLAADCERTRREREERA